MGGSRSRMRDYSGVLGWGGPKVEMRWGGLGAEQGASWGRRAAASVPPLGAVGRPGAWAGGGLRAAAGGGT
jgi:hypothetical protein